MAGSQQAGTVVSLTRAREERAGGALLREVAAELESVRARLRVLCTGGELFAAPGGREGRRLLLAQEGLLQAQRLLVELTGVGPLPAPRLPATRERMLRAAREHLAAARARRGARPVPALHLPRP